ALMIERFASPAGRNNAFDLGYAAAQFLCLRCTVLGLAAKVCGIGASYSRCRRPAFTGPMATKARISLLSIDFARAASSQRRALYASSQNASRVARVEVGHADTIGGYIRLIPIAAFPYWNNAYMGGTPPETAAVFEAMPTAAATRVYPQPRKTDYVMLW